VSRHALSVPCRWAKNDRPTTVTTYATIICTTYVDVSATPPRTPNQALGPMRSTTEATSAPAITIARVPSKARKAKTSRTGTQWRTVSTPSAAPGSSPPR